MDRIVVGIDGSSGSREALRYAADEARLRGLPLRAVSAWHLPYTVYPGAGFTPVLNPSEFEQAAQHLATNEITEVLGGKPDLEIDLVVRQGNAATVLLEESSEASMLVLGSRGHGGFAGLLLGSVSQQCAAHASCPVTVVHER